MARSTQRPTSRTRIFLLDAEPVIRRGLELLITRQRDLEVCGGAGTVQGVLAKIMMLKPDLAVLGLTLHSAPGLKLIRRLRKYCPELKILVFSMEDKLPLVNMVLQAGAHGFVAKQDGSEKILQEVHRLCERQGKQPSQLLKQTDTRRASSAAA